MSPCYDGGVRPWTFVPSLIVFLLLGSGAAAQYQPSKPGRPNFQSQSVEDPKLDTLIQACQKAPRRDKICDALITLQMIGNDSIEAVKEYVELGPYEYYALTALNVALTGRLRVRFALTRTIMSTLDVQKDSTQFSISTKW